ncbi:MAG TPA: Na+/H+ antiporter subunit E [Solirubrobacteraceae bacterium]|nr:Na+/H+ antiporter subunit E [Solirubrobacteraceae bacterium]
MTRSALAQTGLRAVALFALWLLLVDATDSPNMITGAVCAVIFATLSTVVHSLRVDRASLRPGMLRYVHRSFRLLVTDTARVTWALIAHALLRCPSPGHFRAARYRATGEAPTDVARRILTEWGASLGPNRYVIGIDPENNLLLVHELVWSEGPLDPLELG